MLTVLHEKAYRDTDIYTESNNVDGDLTQFNFNHITNNEINHMHKKICPKSMADCKKFDDMVMRASSDLITCFTYIFNKTKNYKIVMTGIKRINSEYLQIVSSSIPF